MFLSKLLKRLSYQLFTIRRNIFLFKPASLFTVMEKEDITKSLLEKRSLGESLNEDALSEKSLNSGNENEETKEESDLGGKLINKAEDPLRVCLQGLDNFSQEKEILKFFQSNFKDEIKLTAILKPKKKNFAFIAFETEEEKAKFVERFTKEDLIIKNKKLKIRPVYQNNFSVKQEKKIKTILNEIEKRQSHQFNPSEEEIKVEADKCIQERVCPWWKTPYHTQIEDKKAMLRDILKTVNQRAKKNLRNDDKVPNWLSKDSCCDMDEFIESDEEYRFYYRNKAELTIGYDPKGSMKVGFNKGKFDAGIMFVDSASDCPTISKEAIVLAEEMEKLIVRIFEQHKIDIYDRFKHTGVWRTFTIRQSDRNKEIFLNIVIARKNVINEEQFEVLSDCLRTTFSQTNIETLFPGFLIRGLFLQYHDDLSDNVPTEQVGKLLFGDNFYTENILGNKFQVSPSAFLQVNTHQCEKLYSAIAKYAEVDEDTVFLDICSGTGTIGISMAKLAKKIVAIEMVEQACKDAEVNVKLNNVTNFEGHCAKVENVIDEIAKNNAGKHKMVGVVDPPRAGLHATVLRALRTCKGLDKLIYVSCNPAAMVDNLMALCLPANKQRKGPPFTPIKCFGVDLFPQTPHYECVMLLKRLYD